MKLLSSIWGVFTTVPFLAFFVVYVLFLLASKNKRMAARWAVNITNVFLIHAVIVAYDQIWPRSITVWVWIGLLFALIASLLIWLQKQKRGRILWGKVSFSTWRLSFLFFMLAYFALFGTGIWKQMQIG
ncbi:DUF3397 domain-containing protein [Brevibacillus ginsengisoli]|uniref:DUF3397 domain-containing protein n=1 Tax=Brevibacillus ginsengisoli TaxID=363854 RepID=UPI003CE67AA0